MRLYAIYKKCALDDGKGECIAIARGKHSPASQDKKAGKPFLWSIQDKLNLIPHRQYQSLNRAELYLLVIHTEKQKSRRSDEGGPHVEHDCASLAVASTGGMGPAWE